MLGCITKIHSDFYYVKTDKKVFICKIREKLKKSKANIYVGDFVMLDDINIESEQAVITGISKRTNYLDRPSIANIDQLIITASLDQPAFCFNQMDRYLVNAEMKNIPAVICINKSDLSDPNNIKDRIQKLYGSLGFKIIFTSAVNGLGVEDLINILVYKKSVITGMSGVGKSSLLNRLNPALKLKTDSVSERSSRGTHTTRHVEILNITLENGKNFQIADTPGFSHLKFDNILPEKINRYFQEINKLSEECRYSDCLHIKEKGCNVLSNLDKIELSRYESYKTFVEEAQEYKKKLAFSGHKNEKNIKILDSKDNDKIGIVKLGTKKRETSRKNKKQKLGHISSLDDAYYNDEEN